MRIGCKNKGMATGRKGNLMIVEDSEDSDDLNENTDVTTVEKTKQKCDKVSRPNRNRKENKTSEAESDIKTAQGEKVNKKEKGKRKPKSSKAEFKTNEQDEANRCDVNSTRDHKNEFNGQPVHTSTNHDYRHMPGLFGNPPPMYQPGPGFPPPLGLVPAFPGFMQNSIPVDYNRWSTNFKGGSNPDYGSGRDNLNTGVPWTNEGTSQRGRGNRSKGGFRSSVNRKYTQSGSFAHDLHPGETYNRKGNYSDRGRGRYTRGRINSRRTFEKNKYYDKGKYEETGNNLESSDNDNLGMNIYEFLLRKCASFAPFDAHFRNFFPENIDVVKWFERHRKRFRIFSKKGKIIYVSAKTNLHLCRHYQTKRGCSNESCKYVHICRHFTDGWCSHQTTCVFNHKFHGVNCNAKIIESAGLSSFSDKEIANLLKQQDPKICPYRNTACRRGEICPYLHICPRYVNQKCGTDSECTLGHSFNTEHNLWILKIFQMDSWLEDEKKDKLLSKVLSLPKFPPRKNRDENKSGNDKQKRNIHEDDVTSDQASDMSSIRDDLSVISFSDIEQSTESSNEDDSETEDSDEEEDIETVEEEKYSRKNRFGPVSDTEFLTGVQVDDDDH